jgi:hypothetical protein
MAELKYAKDLQERATLLDVWLGTSNPAPYPFYLSFSDEFAYIRRIDALMGENAALEDKVAQLEEQVSAAQYDEAVRLFCCGGAGMGHRQL